MAGDPEMAGNCRAGRRSSRLEDLGQKEVEADQYLEAGTGVDLGQGDRQEDHFLQC